MIATTVRSSVRKMAADLVPATVRSSVRKMAADTVAATVLRYSAGTMVGDMGK